MGIFMSTFVIGNYLLFGFDKNRVCSKILLGEINLTLSKVFFLATSNDLYLSLLHSIISYAAPAMVSNVSKK